MAIYRVIKPFDYATSKHYREGDRFISKNKDDILELLRHGYIINQLELEEPCFTPLAVSKLAGIEIAAEDYVEGDKKHFTWDEAMKAVKKLDNGWRLPTRKEWSLICEEFGCDEYGKLSGGLLAKNLNLKANGWKDYNGSLYDSGSRGYWWSSTADNTATRYNLYYYTSNGLYSGNSSNRFYGFSVRCVRDIKDKGTYGL